MAIENVQPQKAYVNKTSLMQTGIPRFLPDILVSFHTTTACYQARGAYTPPGADPDPSYNIISVTTQKTLRNPAGAFSIQLAGDEWVTRLKSQDIVTIAVGLIGFPKSTIMVGLIGGVERVRMIDGQGKPQVYTQVTGIDFAKTLLKANMRVYPKLSVQADNAKQQTPAEKAANETPPVTAPDILYLYKKEVLQTYFSTWVNVTFKLVDNAQELGDSIMRYMFPKIYNVKWKVYDTSKAGGTSKTGEVTRAEPKDVTVTQIVRYIFATGDYRIMYGLSLEGFAGVLWNILENMAVKPIYELFIDTRSSAEIDAEQLVKFSGAQASNEAKGVTTVVDKDTGQALAADGRPVYPSPAITFGEDKAKVIVVFRKTPFDKDNWNSLATATVSEADIGRDMLRQSDDDHFNLFFAGSSIAPQMMIPYDRQRATNTVLHNDGMIGRYAMQPLDLDIHALEVDRESPDSPSVLHMICDQTVNTLKRWFEKNQDLWSGQLDLRPMEKPPCIGQRLLYKGCTIENKVNTDYDFYIEGVTHSFHALTSWKINVTVSRGYEASKRFA